MEREAPLPRRVTARARATAARWPLESTTPIVAPPSANSAAGLSLPSSGRLGPGPPHSLSWPSAAVARQVQYRMAIPSFGPFMTGSVILPVCSMRQVQSAKGQVPTSQRDTTVRPLPPAPASSVADSVSASSVHTSASQVWSHSSPGRRERA